MKNLILLISVSILLTLSCKKKSKTEDNGSSGGTTTGITIPSAPNYVINIPSDADGVLFASKVPYDFSSWTTILGKASAFFYTAPGDFNYVDAGVVKCNDSVLVKQSGGSYYFGGKPINMQNFSGIDFSAGATWSVSGSTAPAFTYSLGTFPTDGVLTSPLLLYKSTNYNLTFSGVTGADSIVVYLGCDSMPTKKTIAGNTASTLILAAQIAATKKAGSTNKGYINIIPYRIQANTTSSKKYYFVNSTTATFTVNIQ